MDLSPLHQVSSWEWRLEPEGAMRVPAVLYGEEGLVAEMDDKVLEQIRNVACLPGIVDAAYTMPDALGAMASRSAGSRVSTLMRAGWYRLGASGSTSRAVCVHC